MIVHTGHCDSVALLIRSRVIPITLSRARCATKVYLEAERRGINCREARSQIKCLCFASKGCRRSRVQIGTVQRNAYFLEYASNVRHTAGILSKRYIRIQLC